MPPPSRRRGRAAVPSRRSGRQRPPQRQLSTASPSPPPRMESTISPSTNPSSDEVQEHSHSQPSSSRVWNADTLVSSPTLPETVTTSGTQLTMEASPKFRKFTQIIAQTITQTLEHRALVPSEKRRAPQLTTPYCRRNTAAPLTRTTPWCRRTTHAPAKKM